MIPGEFTVPVTGVWRVSFSLRSFVNTNQGNSVYISHNQQQLERPLQTITDLYTYSEFKAVWSTGGKELITRAKRGDTFYLSAGRMDNAISNIITCFEFVSL